MTTRIDPLWALAYAIALVACGGDDKPPNTGEPPPQQCPPGQSFNGHYCVAQTAPAPTTTTSPTPSGTNMPPPSPTPLDPTAAAAASVLIDPIAKQSAPPGATAVGALVGAQFGPGQSIETPLQLQPGKCYTVVAAGLPSVQELNVQILPMIAIPGVNPVLAQDQGTGSTAVLGANPNCFKWAAPLAASVRVVLTVTTGQGAAGMQIYEK